jgi:diaminopimelate decarboxylase
VAIVGVGPKGLFALERLLDRAHRAGPDAALEIDLFEPHASPGAGPVYDPEQPRYLRMNLAADRLTIWRPASLAVAAERQLDFNSWIARQGGTDERYPPRAVVGRYLADGLARIRLHAAETVPIELRRETVRSVDARDRGWEVTTLDGSTPHYDEVLLAIGHQGADEHAPRTWAHAAPLIPAVFPVARRLSPEQVAPKATVAIRGFALTFIDAALALTEGRGGAFEPGDHPYRLRYARGAGDVAVVLPFSRSGRPMLAKPGAQLEASIPALATIGEHGRARILALPDCADPMPALLMVLADVAGASLLAASGRQCGGERSRVAAEAARRWLLAASNGAPPNSAEPPATQIERSLAIGAGLHPPDLLWALGHIWRDLYPALITRCSHDGLPAAAWPAFRRLAGELERIAFGPPAINAAKLLALVAAGRVDLTHVAAGRLLTADGDTVLRSAHGERSVDVVVDGVLSGPGAPRAGDGVLARLLSDGHARTRSGRRGLEVATDATCIAASGMRSAGLAVVGRGGEDEVIGNDTLNRALHQDADRWARRVVRRSVRARERHSIPTTS